VVAVVELLKELLVVAVEVVLVVIAHLSVEKTLAGEPPQKLP
jgi:hypothetical protein